MSSSVIETIKEVVSNMNRGLYDFTEIGNVQNAVRVVQIFYRYHPRKSNRSSGIFANTISRNADIISLLH